MISQFGRVLSSPPSNRMLPVIVHTKQSVYKICNFLDGWKICRTEDRHPIGHVDRLTRDGLGTWHKLLEAPKVSIGYPLDFFYPDGRHLRSGVVTCIDGALPPEMIPEFGEESALGPRK